MRKQNNISKQVRLSPSKLIFIPLLRTFFQLLYHQFAWIYDWVAFIVSLGAWQKWIQSAVSYLAGPNVLEVGFGTGHLQARLNQNGLIAIGLDQSDQMVKITKHRLLNLGLPLNIVQGYAQNLPFKNEIFNQVAMTFPAEFLLEEETYHEIHRVLVRGGMLLIIPAAWITGNKPLERVIAWVNRISGQAPQWNEKYLEPLRHLGFEVNWEMVDFSFSRLLVLRLVKRV